jgi:hypothetical protein
VSDGRDAPAGPDPPLWPYGVGCAAVLVLAVLLALLLSWLMGA